MTDHKCTQCDWWKPVSAFPRNASKALGRDSECKRCKAVKASEPQSRFNRWLTTMARKYGMSPADYELMLIAQFGSCAICKQPETRTNSYGEYLNLSVDHDHKTGKVRGLLCASCNKGLGLFQDSPERLMAASWYLKLHEWKKE